ncbi:hypothetical protein IO90_06840 [Chryseobacterium sp. FH1]|nr:hypothetical protein IO90_06840 [Chryseobacterium sp. FH1]
MKNFVNMKSFTVKMFSLECFCFAHSLLFSKTVKNLLIKLTITVDNENIMSIKNSSIGNPSKNKLNIKSNIPTKCAT